MLKRLANLNTVNFYWHMSLTLPRTCSDTEQESMKSFKEEKTRLNFIFLRGKNITGQGSFHRNIFSINE